MTNPRADGMYRVCAGDLQGRRWQVLDGSQRVVFEGSLEDCRAWLDQAEQAESPAFAQRRAETEPSHRVGAAVETSRRWWARWCNWWQARVRRE